MLIGIHHGALSLIEDAQDIQGVGTAAQRPHRTVDRLGPILLPHSWEIDLHDLRVEPNRLPVERQGLPDLDDLRQAWQRVEINGELKSRPIASLLEEGL